MMNPETRKAFDYYVANGPCPDATIQAQADAAFRKFQHLLTEKERRELNATRARMMDSHDQRTDFDRACYAVWQRLFEIKKEPAPQSARQLPPTVSPAPF